MLKTRAIRTPINSFENFQFYGEVDHCDKDVLSKDTMPTARSISPEAEASDRAVGAEYAPVFRSLNLGQSGRWNELFETIAPAWNRESPEAVDAWLEQFPANAQAAARAAIARSEASMELENE